MPTLPPFSFPGLALSVAAGRLVVKGMESLGVAVLVDGAGVAVNRFSWAGVYTAVGDGVGGRTVAVWLKSLTNEVC